MGARQKLNSIHIAGSLVVASLLGGLTQSWLVFLIALVLLLVSGLHSDEIRPHRRRRR